MVLTDKQRKELHNAIYEYLAAPGEDGETSRFGDSAAAFAAEANLASDATTESTSSKTLPLLEKKWTSIVRLQKKVLNLEASLRDAKQQILIHGKGGAMTQNGGVVKGTYNLNTTPRFTMRGHRGPVLSLSFHPVFNLMVSTSEDATTKIWDYETGEFERTLKGHSNAVQCACFNADGTLLATCSSDLSIKLWNFSTFECISTLMGHDHNVTGIAFMPDGNKLVSCSRDKTIKVWEVSTGYCVKTLQGHSEWVRKVAVDVRSSDIIASCSNDHSLAVWNITSGVQLCDLRGHEHVVECLTFSSPAMDKALSAAQRRSNGKEDGDSSTPSGVPQASSTKVKGSVYLISGSRDRTVRIWHIPSSSLSITLCGHDSWVRGVVSEPDGKYVLSAGEDKTLRVWDVVQERCIRTIQGAHDHFVTSLAVHPRLAVVSSGSVDTNIKIWTGISV